jgi:hypothetical protein
VFPADSWLRSKSFQLVENKTFENVVLALIIVNSVLLAVDRPTIVKGSTLDVVLVNFDVAFAAFFTWEMVMKVCDMLRCVALRCVALRCVALRCVALRCVALRCVAFRVPLRGHTGPMRFLEDLSVLCVV